MTTDKNAQKQHFCERGAAIINRPILFRDKSWGAFHYANLCFLASNSPPVTQKSSPPLP